MPVSSNYDEYDKKYCYPGTNVLKNNLNIKNQNELNHAERELTSLRIYELEMHPIKGNFDLKHLQAIHKYIFQDLYDWAGKIRQVDISKGNVFCNFHFINNYGDDIFKKLQKEHYLLNLPRDKFCERLAYFFSEINALHPFREGNGRSQREFIKTLSYAAGYELDFTKVTKELMIEASHKAFYCDYSSMVRMFQNISSSISYKDQFQFISNVIPQNSNFRKEFNQFVKASEYENNY